MELNLACLEWTNVNRNARLLKNKIKSKQNIQNSKDNLQQQQDFGTYLVQIVGRQDTTAENSRLACLSSDQIVNFYDQASLRQLSQIPKPHDNKIVSEIGFFKQQTDSRLFFTCGDDGRFKCWDLRENVQNESILSIDCSDSHELLCADINSNDTLIAIGTNKKIDDSLVFIYDIRFHKKFLYKFCESHSNDVTQVKFDPFRAGKFMSGSVDGLVCLYDLEQKVEAALREEKMDEDNESDEDLDEDPDLMEQVLNTESSIQKIGYLSSSGCLNSAPDQIFAITFTNNLFVWDLSSHDLIYKSKNNAKRGDEDEEDEDYFIDCVYNKRANEEKYELTALMGDKLGNIRVYEKERLVCEMNTNSGRNSRRHRDIIRGSYWNYDNLYTVGEDGFLLKWRLELNDEKEKEEKNNNLKRGLKNDGNEDDGQKRKKNLNKKKKLNLKQKLLKNKK